MRCYQPLTRALRFDYTFLHQRDCSTDVPEEDGSFHSLPRSENYGNVRASANPLLSPLLPQLSFVAAEERRRLSPRMSIEFPDNFSPFVSRCARLGGRASLWQGATRRRRDTLVACAHPCDATCYETRNVTALADYLANEGFFRLLAASLSVLLLFSFYPASGFEHAFLPFSFCSRSTNAMALIRFKEFESWIRKWWWSKQELLFSCFWAWNEGIVGTNRDDDVILWSVIFVRY